MFGTGAGDDVGCDNDECGFWICGYSVRAAIGFFEDDRRDTLRCSCLDSLPETVTYAFGGRYGDPGAFGRLKKIVDYIVSNCKSAKGVDMRTGHLDQAIGPWGAGLACP